MLDRIRTRLRRELHPLVMYRDLRSFYLHESARVARWAKSRRVGTVVPVAVRGLADPAYIRFGTGDDLVLAEMFGSRDYAAVLGLLGPAPKVLDLGANIGLSVRVWLAADPAARVVAVEPDDANLAVARRNVSAAKADGRVELVRGFAAAAAGEGYLSTTASGCGVGRAAAPAAAGAAAVPCHPVADLLERLAPGGGTCDLLKCDIEGGEIELFADCRPWIGRVRNMVVETHDPYTLDALDADLARNGAAMARTVSEVRAGYAVGVYARRSDEAGKRPPAPGG
jgi:FkbM family methyltransferase